MFVGEMKSLCAKKGAFIALVALGCFEIFYGVIYEPALIKSREVSFYKAMGYPGWSAEQNQAAVEYIARINAEWSILALFGILTIILSLACYFISRGGTESRTGSEP
jgi:hypothetical protein